MPLSSVLYEIDIERETLLLIDAPKEFGTTNATMHITDTDRNGNAERILILGGTSKQIVLYAKSKFEFDICDMHGEFGGCKLEEMTPLTKTNTCALCGKIIHEDCDIFKHNKATGNYKCPNCKGFGIQTV